MSKEQKLIKKLYSKPIRNDITFSEIESLASIFGCEVLSGGKHLRVVHKKSGYIVPIPRHGKTVGEIYIKELQKLFNFIIDFREE